MNPLNYQITLLYSSCQHSKKNFKNINKAIILFKIDILNYNHYLLKIYYLIFKIYDILDIIGNNAIKISNKK